MPNQSLKTGIIVWADVCDPISNEPVGEHGCVVLNPQSEIDAGDDLRVAVCTTSFTYPLASGWFEMPCIPGGKKSDGFTEATVVKATWIQRIEQSKVISICANRTPMKIVRQIITWLNSKKP